MENYIIELEHILLELNQYDIGEVCPTPVIERFERVLKRIYEQGYKDGRNDEYQEAIKELNKYR